MRLIGILVAVMVGILTLAWLGVSLRHRSAPPELSGAWYSGNTLMIVDGDRLFVADRLPDGRAPRTWHESEAIWQASVVNCRRDDEDGLSDDVAEYSWQYVRETRTLSFNPPLANERDTWKRACVQVDLSELGTARYQICPQPAMHSGND